MNEIYNFISNLYLIIEVLLAEMKDIDRFHSRDRWPQWGGETIRNI
jgi:hypothetical protein